MLGAAVAAVGIVSKQLTMREPNFTSTQDKACVCITSQLYDRRGEWLFSN